MTFEKAYELLNGDNESDGYYLTSKEEPNDRFIKGFNILAKYDDSVIQGADHDIIYMCDHSENMPEEEIKELSVLGFHLNEDGYWAHYA